MRALSRVLLERLEAEARPERAEQEKKYLKSELAHLGVPVPAIRRTTKALLKEHELDHASMIALVEELWSRPTHELRMAAVEILVARVKELEDEDLALVERLIRESRTWAFVDTLAVHVAGRMIERAPHLGKTLDRWAKDEDFWVRRSAMLALLEPLRRGGGDFDRFARYADTMLEEKEFFIRKAIGWILRATGRKRPELVLAFLGPRIARASGVTVREAIKPLPAGEADALLSAYKTKTKTKTKRKGSSLS